MTARVRRTKDEIEGNYGVSVAFAFDDAVFLRIDLIPSLRFLHRNGIEICLVSGSTVENDTLKQLVLDFPLINWQIKQATADEHVISCSRLLAESIYASSMPYVLIPAPLSRLDDSIIRDLVYLCEAHDNCFAASFFQAPGYARHFDLLLIKKADFDIRKIPACTTFNQFCESIVRDLQITGKKCLNIPGNGSLYAVANCRPESEPGDKLDFSTGKSPLDPLQFETLFSWRHNTMAHVRSQAYAQRFLRYSISNNGAFERSYQLIALVQTYNESKNIQALLAHLDPYCDAIILLDDESTDGTYDLAISPKLLMKVQKKREGFNDLLNRNILLDLVSFFKTEWSYFIDADERFDGRFDQIYQAIGSAKSDVLSFWLVNLWDSEYYYRTDITDSATESCNGILSRPRLFRNNGHLRIRLKVKRKLHFSPVPYFTKPAATQLLLLHYGTLTQQNRVRKHAFYLAEDQLQDKLGYTYNSLLHANTRVLPVEDIQLASTK